MSRSVLTLLLGVVLLAGAAAGYWYLQRNADPVPVAPAPVSTPEPAAAPTQWLIRSLNESDLDPHFSEALGIYLSFRLESVVGASNVTVDWTRADDPPDKGVIKAGIRIVEDDSGAPNYELVISGAGVGHLLDFRDQGEQLDPMIEAGVAQMLGVAQDEARLSDPQATKAPTGVAVDAFVRGMAAQFKGDMKESQGHFLTALEADPEFDFARYELAIVSRRLGEYQQALSLLNQVSLGNREPRWQVRVSNARGITFWILQRHEEAAYEFNRALASDPTPGGRVVLMINLGLVQKASDDLHRASITLTDAVQAADNNFDPRSGASARNALAGVYLLQGRLPEAESVLREALRLSEQVEDFSMTGAILSRLANVLHQQGILEESITHLQRSLRVREEIGEVQRAIDSQLRLALSYLQAGRFVAAEEQAREMLARSQDAEFDTGVVEAYRALTRWAVVSQNWGEFESLQRAHHAAATKAQAESELLANRELVLMAGLERQPDAALVEELEAFVSEARGLGESELANRLQCLVGRVHWALGNPQAAEEQFQACLNGARSDTDRRLMARAQTDLLGLALERGVEEAEPQYQAAEALNPFPYPFLKYKARLLALQGDAEQALQVGFEAQERSGDWWTAEDEALLETFFRQRRSTGTSTPAEY